MKKAKFSHSDWPGLYRKVPPLYIPHPLEYLKLNCLVVKVVLPIPLRTFSSHSNPESDF